MFIKNKQEFIENFNHLIDWEEKYIYLIELGKTLKKMPEKYYKKKYLISGCQNNVWIKIFFDVNFNKLKFYGDSDSSIVKGLLSLIFYFYKDVNIKKIEKFNIYKYIKDIFLEEYISSSRTQGMYSIISFIQKESKKWHNKN